MSTKLARLTPNCLEQEWNEPCRTREQSKYINYHNIWGWGRGEGGCVTQQHCLPDLPDSLLVALNKNGMNLVEPESKVSISIIIPSGVGGEQREGGCVTQQQCLPDLPDSLLVALNKNGMNLVEPESKVSISIIIPSGVGERGGRLCNTTTMSTRLARFTPSCLEQEWNEPCRTREQSKYINYHTIWGWGEGREAV